MGTTTLKGVKADPDRIIEVPAAEVFADWDWNSRSRMVDKDGNLQTGAELTGEGMTFAELCTSIKTEGQRDACIVRPNKNGRKEPYVLVTGFCRREAVVANGPVDGQRHPMLRVIVKNLSDKEARIENVRENTARSSIRDQDVMFGIQDLHAMDPDLKGTDIAKAIGRSDEFVNRCIKVIDKVKPHILEDWRGGDPGPKVSLDNLALKVASAGDQDKVYAELKAARATSNTRAADAWVKTHTVHAIAFGKAMGKCEFAGLVVVKNPGEFFGSKLGLFTGLPEAAPKGRGKEASAEVKERKEKEFQGHRASVIKAALRAYEEAKASS